jgi:hypothetical protein
MARPLLTFSRQKCSNKHHDIDDMPQLMVNNEGQAEEGQLFA